MPVVAVVGYTNAGKTSLIRCLSGSRKAVASAHVFATLDITHHRARLPSSSGGSGSGVGLPGVQLTFVDTIGFMSDLPTSLVAAFRATLDECLNTDLILHIVDISEEGWEERTDHIDRFLAHSGIDVVRGSGPANAQGLSDKPNSSTKVINIGNKADRGLTYLPKEKRDRFDVLISTTEGTGIYQLAELIQLELAQALGWIQRSLGVHQGSPALKWLYSNAMVMDISAHPSNSERLVVSAIFTTATWGQFVSRFGRTAAPVKIE